MELLQNVLLIGMVFCVLLFIGIVFDEYTRKGLSQ